MDFFKEMHPKTWYKNWWLLELGSFVLLNCSIIWSKINASY